MTNENKTVAELLEGVEADAWRARYSENERWRLSAEQVNLWETQALYTEPTFERVLGPVLSGLNEHIAALNALLVQQKRELTELRSEVKRMAPFEYQMGVNYEHYKTATASVERNRDELEKARRLYSAEVLAAGQSQIALGQEIIRLQEQNANLSHAVAELTETKADFYRSGVADGRAQKDAERTSFSIEYKTDPNIRTFLHTSNGAFQVDADGKQERVAGDGCVYQVLGVTGLSWVDVGKSCYDSVKSEHRRILYNRPQEVVETREALRLAHDHMRLFLNNYHAGQNVFDTIHAILTPRGKESGK